MSRENRAETVTDPTKSFSPERYAHKEMASPVAALSNLAVKLGYLALQEANYLDGVGEELTRLRTELIWMKCFLKDAAAARGSRKEVVAAWVAEVRELAYEAEDIIDTFDIQISSKQRSCILKEDLWLHKMGKKMDELTEKIAILTRRAQTYGIQPAADDAESSARRMPLQETFPNEIEKDVVGFDGYTKSLASVLQDKERQTYEVVVIAGMGGLGKTTLAKKVYHRSEIGDHFKQFAWVYVSQQYQPRHVWQQILLDLKSSKERRPIQQNQSLLDPESQTKGRRPETRTRLKGENIKRNEILNLTDRELKERITKKLRKKKCLIVLDDLWRNEDWNLLKAAFHMDEQSNLSKILITTRQETVAEGPNRFLLKPACLNKEQSWDLLRKIVFPSSRREGADRSCIEIKDPRTTLTREGAGPAGSTNEIEDLERTSAQEERTTKTEDPKRTMKKEGEERTTKVEDPKKTLGKASAERITGAQGSKRTPEKEAGRTTQVEDSKRKLAHKMIKHCGGLPLAIRVLGGLLTTSSTEWSTILTNIKSLIARGGNQGLENTGVRNILATSYEDLPTHLKSCFMYMAQFPEDYEIYTDKLEKMWIAEGMVELTQVHWEEGQEELEDLAKSYLNQLIHRSMVLVGNRGPNNELETCHLHDLMRDLCLSKAKEENMLQILNQTVKDDKSGVHSMSKSGYVRRLAIHELDLLYPNPHLRSLWFFSGIFRCTELEAESNEISAWSWKMFWRSKQFLVFVTNKYKLLRVLDLDGVFLPAITLPNEIGELIYLKMLTLGEIKVIKLPSSLGKLRRLQTLDLEKAFIFWVANVAWELEQLRHLYLPLSFDCDVWKFKIGRCRNLRTLRNFRFRQRGELRSIGELTQLRELDIVIDSKDLTQGLLEDFSLALMNRRNLRSLSMHITDMRASGNPLMDITPILSALQSCPNVYKLQLFGYSRLIVIEFPEDSRLFPATVTHLAFGRCYFYESLISNLGKFPNLRFLSLSSIGLGPDSRRLRCTQGFRELVFLSLDDLHFLQELIIDKETMSRLELMEIRSCPDLESAPKGLKSIESLQELKIISMPKQFNNRLVPGGADYEEVKHIPSVLLIDAYGPITSYGGIGRKRARMRTPKSEGPL